MRVLERVRGGHLAADKVKIRLSAPPANESGTALRELTRESRSTGRRREGPTTGRQAAADACRAAT